MENDYKSAIEKIIHFACTETPQNEQLLINAIHSIDLFLENEQRLTDNKIMEYVSERNYEKASEYMMMSKLISEVNAEISNIEGIDNLMKKNRKLKAMSDNEQTEDLEEADIEWEVMDEDRINYEKYRVDEGISYDLRKDFRYTKPAAFSLDGEKYSARQWKLLLLCTCEILAKKNPVLFESFIKDKFMQGKTRTYFSKSAEGMSNPEIIKNTQIYVETNLSANGTRDLVIRMLEKYRIPLAAFRIFLSKDFTPLHAIETKENISEKESFKEEVDIGMENICEDFDYKTGKCMNEQSPLFVMKCNHQENCPYIKKPKIYYIPKEVLKAKNCPKCNCEMEHTSFQVLYTSNGSKREYSLNGYWCQTCMQAFINKELFMSFTKNKDVTQFNIKFQEWNN